MAVWLKLLALTVKTSTLLWKLLSFSHSALCLRKEDNSPKGQLACNIWLACLSRESTRQAVIVLIQKEAGTLNSKYYGGGLWCVPSTTLWTGGLRDNHFPFSCDLSLSLATGWERWYMFIWCDFGCAINPQMNPQFSCVCSNSHRSCLCIRASPSKDKLSLGEESQTFITKASIISLGEPIAILSGIPKKAILMEEKGRVSAADLRFVSLH